MYDKTNFRVSSPPKSLSKVVVCVSTLRMYPHSGYFLVKSKGFESMNIDILFVSYHSKLTFETLIERKLLVL